MFVIIIFNVRIINVQILSNFKYFFTEEEAQKYICRNKPSYSIQELLDMFKCEDLVSTLRQSLTDKLYNTNK